jgi:glutathione synthase/RimK-type ligase-like ATP-grasp enzyme
MAHIAIIDGHAFNFAILRRAVELGHTVTFVRQQSYQWYPNTPSIEATIGLASRVISLANLTDSGELVRSLHHASNGDPIDAVINLVDPTIEATAEACTILGIPFTDYYGVRNARNKVRTRELVRDAGLQSIDFAHITEPSEIRRVLGRFDFPIMLKPASGFGSLVCRRADNFREACIAAREAFSLADTLPAFLRPQFSRGVLVET